MSFFITKESGEKEEFSLKKFSRSLRKAGADTQWINEIIEEIKAIKPTSTQEIHEYALSRLTQKSPPIAARYNLKRALIEFGPAGYPFEKYAAKLLEFEGYQTKTDQILAGACVDHEVDIIASKNNQYFMVECKFHVNLGIKSDVKVALYTQARFEDLQKAMKKYKKETQKLHQPWLITNTKFTTEVIKYAHCINMMLTGWSYPHGKSLAELIDHYGLHPITALTSLSKQQKKSFIEHGIILCRDIPLYKNELQQFGIQPKDINHLLKESEDVCNLPSTSDREE
jgi:Holliday junction resolvase-like predicted endonuclease